MAEFQGLNDSGKREEMNTGSVRDTNEGKPRPDLVNPLVERRVAMHYANGCIKYGERNYELGQRTSRYLESGRRHILDYMEGKRDEDHLAAIVWNFQQIIMNEEMVDRGIYGSEIDDRLDYTSREGWEGTIKARALAENRMRADEMESQDDEYNRVETHTTEGNGLEINIIAPDGMDTIDVFSEMADYVAKILERLATPDRPCPVEPCAHVNDDGQTCDTCPGGHDGV
jgi:hypothetical protein